MIRISACSSGCHHLGALRNFHSPVNHIAKRSFAHFERTHTTIYIPQRKYSDHKKDPNSEEENARILKIIKKRKVKYPLSNVLIGAPPSGSLDEIELLVAACKGNLLAKTELKRTRTSYLHLKHLLKSKKD